MPLQRPMRSRAVLQIFQGIGLYQSDGRSEGERMVNHSPIRIRRRENDGNS